MTPLILATLIVTFGYTLACWLLPFGTCRRCSGAGTHPALVTRRMRPCRRCKGSGRRLRYGRRAYNYLNRVHHDATAARRAAR